MKDMLSVRRLGFSSGDESLHFQAFANMLHDFKLASFIYLKIKNTATKFHIWYLSKHFPIITSMFVEAFGCKPNLPNPLIPVIKDQYFN